MIANKEGQELDLGSAEAGKLVEQGAEEELDTVDMTRTFQELFVAAATGLAMTAVFKYLGGLFPTVVQSAIKVAVDSAVKNTTLTKKEVEDLPTFFVFKARTSRIYDNDVDAITHVPVWQILTYNGRGNDVTGDNRYEATRGYSPTANDITNGWVERDEYPFASTIQGGYGACIKLYRRVNTRYRGMTFENSIKHNYNGREEPSWSLQFLKVLL